MKILKDKGIMSVIVIILFIYMQNDIRKSFIFLSSLFLHEISHIFAAKVSNVKITSFSLLPFGARLEAESLPLSYSAMFMYLMGPIGNLIFAFLILFVSYFYIIPSYDFFIFYNILLCFINLVPIMPLDAARVLYIFLSKKLSPIKAIDITIALSKVIALIIFILGVYVYIFSERNIFLISLSLFFMYIIRREESALMYNYMSESVKKEL